MQTVSYAANPFALMLDPQAVVNAMDKSDRLARLRSQIFRPLDKPLIAKLSDSVQAYDEAIDYEADLEQLDD